MVGGVRQHSRSRALLLTSARKYGNLEANNEHDAIWGSIEYGISDPTAIPSMVGSRTPAVAMNEYLAGSGQHSERMDRLMRPVYGFGDEARLIIQDERGTWGALALFRGTGDAPFAHDDADFLVSVADSLARGVRAGILARLAPAADLVPVADGPAVVIVNKADEITQISLGAQERLASFGTTPQAGDPMCFVNGVVAAARRVSVGEADQLPRVRVRAENGTWVVLHASPLHNAHGATGDVVVIEEARPPEIVSIVVQAFALTPRERDVTRLVLQGLETKEMATTLHLSAYTVQDHLKAIFDKAGVRSRRELISRIYFDQYVPRIGDAVGGDGWFAGAGRSGAE